MPRALSVLALIAVVTSAWPAEPLDDTLPPAAVVRIGSTKFRVGIGVRSIAYSKDGKSLYSAGGDGYLRVWDAATGRESKRWQHRFGSITSMRLSPDGKQLAVVDGGGNVAIWDAATGESRVMLQTRSYGELPMAWTSDSKRLVLATTNSTVRVIDAENGSESANWQVQVRQQQFAGMAVSPDDKQIVIIGSQGESHVSDLKGKETLKLEVPAGTVGPYYVPARTVAFSPDGQWLCAVSHNRGITIWDANTGKIAQNYDATNPSRAIAATAIAFSPNSRFLATASSDGTVRVYGLASGRELRSFAAGRAGPSALVFSPDGKHLVASGGGPALHIWDLATGKPLFEQVGHAGSVMSLAFLADGNLVSMAQDSTLRYWDSTTGKALDRQDLNYLHGTNLAADPDGRSVKYVSTSPTGAYGQFRWTPGSGKAAAHIPGLAITSTNTQLTADGRFGVIYTGQILQAFDAAAGKTLRTYAWTTIRPSATAISPDGRSVAFVDTAKPGGRIVVWDTATGTDRELASGSPESSAAGRIAFTPDGRGLLTTHNNLAARFWELATGLTRLRIDIPPAMPLRTFAFSQDGRLVAIGSTIGTVRLFDAITGTELGMAEGHKSMVEALAFSRDGTRLASGSADASLVVWDVAKLAHDKLPRRLGADATAAQLDNWWNDLGSNEGNRANVAVWRLSEAPADKVIAMARERLQASAKPSAEQVAKWIKDLDDDKFAVRNRAAKALAAAGDDVKAALDEAMKQTLSDEVRTRIDKILKSLQDGTSATRLRPIRVVEVLDRLGTPDARKLLEEMVKQSYGDDVKRELDRILKKN